MTPDRWRYLCWAVVLAVLAVVVAQIGNNGPTDNPQYEAIVKAHSRAIHARDSVKTVAAEARKENVVVRRKYTEARPR